MTEVEGVFQVASFSKDRKRAATLYETPQRPRSLYLLEGTTLERKELVNLNPQVEDLVMPRSEVVSWTSRDGTEIEGVLHLPADYEEGTRIPFIMNIHGGPAGVWRYNFNSAAAVYAGLGYAVLSPNVRGSSGYSDDLLRGNLNDIGGGDYWDVMTGIDAMVERGIADPEHLGVRGWSYGGILGGWTITQTDRFKAASLGAMVADWTSEYAMGFNNDIRYWYIGGTPWENPEGYRKQSAFTYIDNVTTPTILFHGERDTTDTIGQSMIFYQGLKDRGVDTRFIRFPREPHGFREPSHQRIRDMEEIAWFQKYIRGVDFEIPERKKDEEAGDEENKPTTDGSN
jgi:dipeptidyl aminopeptidase/acylaminoacyl peptidase